MNRRHVWAVAAATVALTGTGAFAQLIGGQGSTGMLTEDGARVQVLGRVRSADADSFVLVVRNMSFRVQATRADVTSRQNVREGDRVRVFGDLLGADRIDAGQVQIVERASRGEARGGRDGEDGEGSRRRSYTGTIKEIDRQSGRMVLAVPAGNLRVTLDEGTAFVRSGRTARLLDFKVGESVRVVGQRSGVNSIDARRVVFGDTASAAAGWTNGAVGEIVSLDSRAKEMEVEFDGDVWTVKVGAAPIRLDGGRRLELDQLRLEYDVRVFGTARGARTIEASNIEVISTRPAPRR